MEYDWAWRNDGPMPFIKLLREGVEACSGELYLRRVYALTLVEESYYFGLIPGVLQENRREELKLWYRLIEINFVRAYLHERRAGLKPRYPGPPPGTEDTRVAAFVDVKKAYRSTQCVIAGPVLQAVTDICCEFMKAQLNYECDQHPGNTCPNILVVRGSSGWTYCRATYTCNYCPICGTKQPKTDENVKE